MKSSFSFCLVTVIMFGMRLALCQSPGYKIESFQDTYSEITDYESIVIETDGFLFWDVEFPFGFQFPFYDSTYNSVTFNHTGWGYFTDEEELALLLFNCNAFVTELNQDTSFIPSDMRYKYVTSNDIDALVLQFTKYRFFADPYVDMCDTYMNWQVWLFENGVIEIRFGEMHMDNNPIYRPGKGFFDYNEEGVDTTALYGPFVSISNPKDESDAISFSGSYNDFEAGDWLFDILNVMPPIGWVIRFVPKSVGVFEPDYKSYEVAINPNPANSFIQIQQPGSRVSINDHTGKVVYNEIVNGDRINISAFPPGMYFVKMESGKNVKVGRFIKS